VTLPVAPPVEPMLAKRVAALPPGEDWLFEPKWDGFRVLVFRDGDELFIQSRDLKPLLRYFPELSAPLLAALPERCVLDGEIVIARGGALDFEALQMRLHPAASRVKLLAAELPASVVFWASSVCRYTDQKSAGIPGWAVMQPATRAPLLRKLK